MVTTAVALAVNTPAVVLLMVRVHVSVFPTGAAQMTAPRVEGVGVTLAVTLVNVGVPVESGSAFTVMVKVCAWFSSLVAVAVMPTFAST